MKTNTKRFGWLGFSVIATVIGVLAANAANATTITTAYYHLGEADTSAALNTPPHDGDGGGALTLDSSGNGFDLTRTGTPTYSTSLVAPGTGSTLSMGFVGTNVAADADWYSRGAALLTSTTYVFMDAWAYPTSDSAVGYVAYNGDAAANGYGFLQDGPYWSFIEGDVNINIGDPTITPSVAVVAGQWVHLSLLIDGSGTLTGYINGTLVVTDTTPAHTPSGGFFIGDDGTNYGGFTGNIDEVSIGQTPEPVSAALLAPAALLLLRRRRAWRR